MNELVIGVFIGLAILALMMVALWVVEFTAYLIALALLSLWDFVNNRKRWRA